MRRADQTDVTHDTTPVIGVDIGGANLKYATSSGRARSTAYPMWRQPEKLAATLAENLNEFGKANQLAVTMTGELADCFVDRSQGVEHIVRHTCQAADQLGVEQVVFYGVDGRFRSADEAVLAVDMVAAANWHALASFVGQFVSPNSLLIDIGSTTTDIISVQNGQVATTSQTDFERLCEGSLVYVGCRRTPVCALVQELRFRGQVCRVMNELFATIDDARLLLGRTVENASEMDTADGKPRTIEFSIGRLARMIGLDQRTVSHTDAIDLAKQVMAAAKRETQNALNQVGKNSDTIVISGHGQDLIDLPSASTIIQLSETLGEQISRCAPSYAVARLSGMKVNATCGE